LAFERRVAEAYRRLGANRIIHNTILDGSQVDILVVHKQVLSSKLLKEWQQEGKVIKAKRGTYRCVPGSDELMNIYQTLLKQLKPAPKEGT